jgi:hypothetical protein
VGVIWGRDCDVAIGRHGFNVLAYVWDETALDYQTGANGVRVGDILPRWADGLDGGAELSGAK